MILARTPATAATATTATTGAAAGAPATPGTDRPRRWWRAWRTAIALGVCLLALPLHGDETAAAPPAERLELAWSDRMLTVRGPGLPVDGVRIWYLEAYCRSKSTKRDWRETVIPHRSQLLEGSDARTIRILDEVDGGVEVLHEIRADRDEVDFRVVAVNRGAERVDAVWVQPCLRVGGFTGKDQEGYLESSFVFVGGEPKRLSALPRAEDAIYRGGQVYVPAEIDRDDVNPRPLSPVVPDNGLIGCVSEDGKWIVATAWEPYQELFQGVIVCLHSDFRLGGLEPGEVKRARGKLYVVPNDPQALVERYLRAFPEHRP
jgi:hypothetical protein